jgi:hypothetical protein
MDEAEVPSHRDVGTPKRQASRVRSSKPFLTSIHSERCLTTRKGRDAMTASAADPLAAALIELVREAAREGAERALAARRATEPPLPIALLDKRELAHALRVSVAKVDRLSRDGRIPFLDP